MKYNKKAYNRKQAPEAFLDITDEGMMIKTDNHGNTFMEDPVTHEKYLISSKTAVH